MPYEPDAPPGSAPSTMQVYPPHMDQSVDSRTLLGKNGQVWIKHRGRMYQLRETRNGKLILTS